MSFNASLNLKKEAEKQLNSLGYWFRQKYNLSPKDPRYLNCEEWELALEFELQDLIEKRVKSRPQQTMCPKCGSALVENICTKCGEVVDSTKETYFDPDFDEYFDKVEKECAEFNAAGGLKSLKYEEVPE